MLRTIILMTCLSMLLFAAPPAGAADDGEVRVPLGKYEDLVKRAAGEAGRPAPAPYALGESRVIVTVREEEGRVSAAVHVDLSINILEDQWTLVPVLPSGTAVRSSMVESDRVHFIQSPEGLAWSVSEAGEYEMILDYDIEGYRSEGGATLAVPVPRTAQTKLTATIPGKGIEVTVIPASGVKTVSQGERTVVTGSVPSTSSIQVSWRTAAGVGYAVSRTRYEGELKGSAVSWVAAYTVDLFAGGSVSIPVLPVEVTVSDVKVDGKPATVTMDQGLFHTRLEGKGTRRVEVFFEVPVEAGGESVLRYRIRIRNR